MTTAGTEIFSPNAQYLLCTRGYAHKGSAHPVCPHKENHNGEDVRHETQEDVIERVGMYKYEYGALLRGNLFAPNSPTWFNLPCKVCEQETVQGTCSACFKFDVDDTMNSILDVTKKAGLVLKAGGGVGYVVSAVRPEGADVNSTHRHALGPLGVLRIYQVLAKEITQGGQRDAAQMAILHCDHKDIGKFIEMKLDHPELLDTFNISVACTDEFMAKVEHGDGREAQLFKQMVVNAWENGDPGCYFIDAAERGNPTPWLGQLTGTNPCGEVPLLDNEPCNLGSINLGKFVTPNGQDIHWERIEQTVRTAINFLDDILDVNEFPTPEIDAAARLTRKLGLGVMGWADMLALLKMPYGSDQSIDLGRNVMQFINAHAQAASQRLGMEKGPAPCFTNHIVETTPLDTPTEGPPLHTQRNATVTCIAPTGTIAILMGASGGIEPHFKLEWDRKTGEGHVMTERLSDYLELGDFVPLTAHEIESEQQVWMQAAFQEHVDLAVSKTINLPSSASPKQISDAYLLAWKTGCKGVTVFRDGCRDSQVLTEVGGHEEKAWKGSNPTEANLIDIIEGNDVGERPAISPGLMIDEADDVKRPINTRPDYEEGLRRIEEQSSTRHKLPATRKAINHRFQVGDQEGYLSFGLYEDGAPGEVFITSSKQGSTIRGLLDGIGILTSLALQYGVPVEVLVRKFRRMTFDPQGPTQNPDIPFASSILDYLGHFLEAQFTENPPIVVLEEEIAQDVKAYLDAKPGILPRVGEATINVGIRNGNGDTCPDCGAVTIYTEGCTKCSVNCGYEKC